MPAHTHPPAAGRDGGFTLDASVGVEAMLEAEWLLTTGLGGYAMGSALGAPTRRYHALLVGAESPPTHRVVALAQVADTLILAPGTKGERRVDLATFSFEGAPLHPSGHERLKRFEKGLACRWVFDVDGHEVARELSLGDDEAQAALRWIVPRELGPAQVEVAPLVALRDFHALLDERTGPRFVVDAGLCECEVGVGGSTLRLVGSGGSFRRAGHWWKGLRYRVEARRGFPDREDLHAPGRFTLEGGARPDGAEECTLIATLEPPHRAPERPARRERVRLAAERLERAAPLGASPGEARALAQAADDFVARRRLRTGWSTTILAGFPWFADWGRDAMIALPGLLLTTGRLDEAREALRLFASHLKDGLIPNRFDDYTDEAHYNTADATLWFVHACCEHARASGAFDEDLARASLEAMEAHARGRTPDIRLDERDGLLAVGGPQTQLTWMDARHGGVTFTPRHGKPVEINALWIHALRSACEALGQREGSRCAALGDLAERAAAAFNEQFWSPERRWLADRLVEEGGVWRAVWERRPNQVIAAALRLGPLDAQRRRGVVALARRELLTPCGLRSLAPGEAGYRARYEGSPFERDGAYHNGTAWAWLLGPYVEALLRSEGFSDEARKAGRAALRPLLDRLGEGCLGQAAEIFDSEGDPQRARGCPAQAWSVAEVIRGLALCDGGSA